MSDIERRNYGAEGSVERENKKAEYLTKYKKTGARAPYTEQALGITSLDLKEVVEEKQSEQLVEGVATAAKMYASAALSPIGGKIAGKAIDKIASSDLAKKAAGAAKNVKKLAKIYSSAGFLIPAVLIGAVVIFVMITVMQTFGANDALTRTISAIAACSDGIDFTCVKDTIEDKAGQAIENSNQLPPEE